MSDFLNAYNQQQAQQAVASPAPIAKPVATSFPQAPDTHNGFQPGQAGYNMSFGPPPPPPATLHPLEAARQSAANIAAPGLATPPPVQRPLELHTGSPAPQAPVQTPPVQAPVVQAPPAQAPQMQAPPMQTQQLPSFQPQQPQIQPQQQSQQQSVEQGALQGGASSVQNFMAALNRVGAGSNNTFMNAPTQMPSQAQASFLGNALGGNDSGTVSYTSGFNTDPNKVGFTGGYSANNNQQSSAYNSQFGNGGGGTTVMGGPGTAASAGGVDGAGGFGVGSIPSLAKYGIGSTATTGGAAGGAPLWTPPQDGDGGFGQGGAGAVGAGGSGQAVSQTGVNRNVATGGSTPIMTVSDGTDGNNAGTVTSYKSPTPSLVTVPGVSYRPPSAGFTSGTLMSDQTTKTDVKNADYKVQGFLDAIKAHSYEYKNPKHGEGRFVSPMAQEIEKTALGKSAIINTPEGKMVDYARLSGVMLAAQSMMNNRLNDIEKQFRANSKKRK